MTRLIASLLPRNEFRWCLALALAGFLAPLCAAEKKPLKLDDYLRMVVERNETVQAQLLGTESTRQRALAERGIFEPEWGSSAAREANKRRNTTEQQRNLAGVPILDERNNRFDSAIEQLTPAGAKLRLGYTLNNFNNNLGAPTSLGNPTRSDEWQGFAGATLTQPLLKNGGSAGTLAALRIASINSESAFQEYRRQLMVTLSQAEAAYWGVYFAQEQAKFLDESVAVAESILSDSREKLKAGKGSELEVLEAEAGVALRHTRATIDDYDTMVRFNERLLRTERERLLVGKVEGHRVLEVEAGLFEVKQGMAAARVQLRRAAIELYLAEGSTLKRRRMEFTEKELREQTRRLIDGPKKKSPPPASYVPEKLNLKR